MDTGSFDRIEYVNELSSATLLGGDEIYLLAHDTNTSPTKSKIDFNNTLSATSKLINGVVDEHKPLMITLLEKEFKN